MMELSRLDGSEFYLNPLLVETIEATPDTVILLTGGRRYVVREGAEATRKAWEAAVGQIGRGTLGIARLIERERGENTNG